MKTLLVMGLLTFSAGTMASVVKSDDLKNGCTLYRVVHAESKKPMKSNETVFYSKEVYGLAFKNLDVNFDNREAEVDVVMSIVLGFNRNLTATKPKISADNAQFKALINQVNRTVHLLESVCINSNNEIIYVKAQEGN